MKNYFETSFGDQIEIINDFPALYPETKNRIKSLARYYRQVDNILKTDLKITPPLINRMIENANRSGALGSKIVGSGGGGCIVAIADKNYKEKIINSIIKTGAKDAFSVNISPS